MTFIGGLGGGLVFPILPALGLKLGIAGAMIGFILSMNRITRLLFDSLAGRLVDRIGGRIPIAVGLAIEGLGILCYSGGVDFGPASWWFLAGRALFGIGSALMFVGAQATVLALSTAANRGRLAATVRIAMSLGLPGGLVIGGLIADRVSNDAAFLTGAALTFFGAAAALRLVPRTRPGQVGAHGRSASSERLSSLPEFGFVATAWGFNLLVFLTVQGVLLATLVVLVRQRGLSALGFGDEGTAGIVMAVMMACSSVVALALGRRLDRLPSRAAFVMPALGGVAAGFAVLGLTHGLAGAFFGAVLVGGSFNGITLPMLTLLGDVTPPDHYGRAVGYYQLFGDVGGSLGPILGLEAGLHFGMLPTYLGVAALLALCVPAALWAARRERAVQRLRSGTRRLP